MPSAPGVRTKPRERALPRVESAWNVVLLDDDDHTYDYVVEMLGRLFGHGFQEAWAMAREVDGSGRAVVWSGEREQAEFHQERIHGWGADPRIARSRGSMTAVVERAG